MNERPTFLLVDDRENDLALLSAAFPMAAMLRCRCDKVSLQVTHALIHSDATTQPNQH